MSVELQNKILLGEMTWLEVREAINAGAIAVVPVGSIENHGPHLPLDTDSVIAFEIAKAAVQKASPGVRAIVLPPICYGYSEMHMAFPGTITARDANLTNYLEDVCMSLVRHGIKKIVILNGHGGNRGALQFASRRVLNKTGALVATVPLPFYNLISKKKLAEVCTSEKGGVCHGGEFETSIYLALHPELVNMDLAVKHIPSFEESRFLSRDPRIPHPVQATLWSKTENLSKTGAIGDALAATAEKGRRLLEITAQNLAEFLMEFSKMEAGEVTPPSNETY